MSKSELQLVTQGCVQFLQQQHRQFDIPAVESERKGTQDDCAPAATAAAACSATLLADINIATATATASIATSSCNDSRSETATPAGGPIAVTVAADHIYMAHLVTAILCLCMAPRSQVLRQLQIGSSFIKEADGKYWVRQLADMCKNGKPTLFAVPLLLTPVIDYYLTHVRPRLLVRQDGISPAHNYVFCKNNGTAPRTDFSTCTNLVTLQIIGRPINAHAFRAAVITTFYGTNASQADMDTLANIMSHDATTARNYYFRPAHMRAADETSERMMQQLLP